MTGCVLCDVHARAELVVAQTARWSLHAFEERFPAGTLLLSAREHRTLAEIDTGSWAEAAPLIAKGTDLLYRVRRADKVYVCSFGEVLEHVHVVFLPKQPGDEAAHGGKRAAALFEALSDAGAADPSEVLAWAARYRGAL